MSDKLGGQGQHDRMRGIGMQDASRDHSPTGILPDTRKWARDSIFGTAGLEGKGRLSIVA